jgi:hypothetical protein
MALVEVSRTTRLYVEMDMLEIHESTSAMKMMNDFLHQSTRETYKARATLSKAKIRTTRACT